MGDYDDLRAEYDEGRAWISKVQPAIVFPEVLGPQHIDDDARLFANRYELIKSLHEFTGGRIAELGVLFGDFSRFLIDKLKPTRFDAYDTFQCHKVPFIWHHSTSDIFKGATQREYYAKRFEKEIKSGQLFIFEGDSSEELNKQENHAYDLIYVDADHRLPGVRRDAAVAVTKLKTDGLLIFNDYIMWDYIGHSPFGIIQVVNELCVTEGWKIVHFALEPGMYCDVAICKTKRPELNE
jgi:hypothetical protein